MWGCCCVASFLSQYKYCRELDLNPSPGPCCLIVDCGYSFTHLVPYYDGRLIRKAIRRYIYFEWQSLFLNCIFKCFLSGWTVVVVMFAYKKLSGKFCRCIFNMYTILCCHLAYCCYIENEKKCRDRWEFFKLFIETCFSQWVKHKPNGVNACLCVMYV